ncbi:MAG: hypothetical protein R3330_10830, partial [Saprospiraceae bacterium]|nr:hypothetical protein [Saprospiraceae bacterium]
MDACASRLMNTRVIDDFLECPPLDEIRRLTALNRERLRDEVLIKYTSEMDADRDGYFDLQKRLNRQIVARLTGLGHDVPTSALTLSLLRISGAGYDGSLHHDKNCNPARKLTVVLYFNTPDAGGELVFPCYDRNRQR